MDNRIISLLEYGRESRNIEFKRSYNWNNRKHKAKIVKTIMAMSNIRDGGYLIFGVDENNGQYTPVGMPQNEYDLINSDNVLAFVNSFADPYVEIDIYKGEYQNKLFVVIEVKEFREYPVVCKKNWEYGLYQGVIYTRARRMPETVPVPSQSEMREIINIAVEKGIREFYRKLSVAGICVQTQSSDRQIFDNELGGL